MHRSIPIYYSEYGRYITRFRSIPLYIDGLIVVYRRVLLSAYNITKNGQFVKSARIVGDTIAKYHPHGDQACYQSLVKLVRRGFLDSDSNFGKIGAVQDAPAAAMRYTECRISRWVVDFAFKYIDYVPWAVLEQGMEKEPLYLPAPLPIGIIGDNGYYSGMAFHKSTVPYYRIGNLAKRLKDLLDKKQNPITIVPAIRHCIIKEGEENAFEKILRNGHGKVIVEPTVSIGKKEITLKGKPKSYLKLFEADYSREKKFEGYCFDESVGEDCIVVIERANRSVDLNNLAKEIMKYVTATIVFDCIFCDFDGKIHKLGIDQLLLNNYSCYIHAVKEKRKRDVDKYVEQLRKTKIIQLIRDVYDKLHGKITSLSDLISVFHQLPQETKTIIVEKFDKDKNDWVNKKEQITEEDIVKTAEKSSIRKLIETKIDINKIQQQITEAKKSYFNTERDCYSVIDQLTQV